MAYVRSAPSKAIKLPISTTVSGCPASKITNLPSLKREHTIAGRGETKRGGVWPGRKGRRRFGSSIRHLSLVHTRVSKINVLNVSSEVRTILFVLKIDGGTKPAVDHQFIRG